MQAAQLNSSEYADRLFKEADFARSEHRSIRFADCVFERCNFSEAALLRCRFGDCEFRHCNLSLLKVAGSSFAGIRFADCKMIGVNWTSAEWPKQPLGSALAFEQCLLDDCSFYGLKLKQLKLVRCRAREADFSEAHCEQADFRHSDLSGCLFRSTGLRGADSTGAVGYNIDVLHNEVREAKFSLPEALSLLDGLKIEISK